MRQSGKTVTLCIFGLYAAALVAAACGLDRWHPTRDSAGAVKLASLRRLLAREPGRPLVVMLGSSRTYALFHARRLDGLAGPDGRPVLAYNFGVPTFGPLHEYLLLRQMLAAGIRPRLLLVEVPPPLMNEPREEAVSEETWTASEWLTLPELATLGPYFAWPLSKCRAWLESRLAPAYAFRDRLREALQEPFAPRRPVSREFFCDARGFQLPEWLTPAACARRLEVSRREFFDSLQAYRLGNGSARALRDLVDLAHRERVPLVLVLPPESSTFRGWYAPGALEPLDRLVADLHRAYGVPVVDATGWLPDEDFADGHHPLAGGAEAFTARLIEEVRPLLAPAAKASPPSPPPLPSRESVR
jgi:hypothetical protein